MNTYKITLETKRLIGTHGKAFWVCLAKATSDTDTAIFSESLSGDTYEDARDRTLAKLKDTLTHRETAVFETFYYNAATDQLTAWPLKPGDTIEGSSV